MQHSGRMQTLMIRAVSGGSALEIQAALAAFQPELVEVGDSYTVVVELGREAQIVGVLNALQDFVTERADGAARVDFNGRSYTMLPEPQQPGGL